MIAPHTDLRANHATASRRRPIGTVAAGIGATVVIALSPYLTTTGSAAVVCQSVPTASDHVSTERAMREMRSTIRALYGPQPPHQRSRQRGS